MPLNYYPSQGEVVWCNYASGFVAPEMIKPRPVVIISPRLRRRSDLATVVPLSTTEPEPIEDHHYCLALVTSLPAPFDSPTMWVKGDMVATVSLSRLDRFRDGRITGSGARKYRTGNVTAAQFVEIRKAVLFGIGFGSLTQHL